jgi:hypothetical protein
MHIRKQSSSQKVNNLDMFSPDLDDPQPFQNLITQFQMLNGDKIGKIVNYRLKNVLKKQRFN